MGDPKNPMDILLDIPGSLYEQVIKQIETIEDSLEEKIKEFIEATLKGLTRGIDDALTGLKLISKLQAEMIEDRVGIMTNSICFFLTGERVSQEKMRQYTYDVKSLVDSPTSAQLVEILSNYILKQNLLSELLRNIVEGFLKKDGNFSNLFDKLMIKPQVYPGSLSKWLTDESTYYANPGDKYLIHEEYHFRRELFIALDAYIKNEVSLLTQSTQQSGQRSAENGQDSREALYLLGDLINRLFTTSLKYLFHMPAMSYGAVNQPTVLKSLVNTTNNYTYMTPEQRHHYIVEKYALSIPRHISYPISGGLGVVLNGIWEISPNNIALCDTISRTISTVVSGLLESIVHGMAKGFQVVEIYKEDPLLSKNPANHIAVDIPTVPVLNVPEDTSIQIAITSSYDQLISQVPYFQDVIANYNNLINKIIAGLENEPTQIIRNIIEGLFKDLMVYATTVYGHQLDVEDNQSVDLLDVNPYGEFGRIEATCKYDKTTQNIRTLPVLHMYADGMISILSKPEIFPDGVIKYQPLQRDFMDPNVILFTNYGSVKRLSID